MSLALLQNATAVAWNQGLSVPCGATGGTAPYIYSIIKAGAGGSIDGSSGLYTAPNAVGVDVLQVMDGSGATAIGSIAVLTPLQLVADIIRTCMGLSSQQVYLYQQKFNIPIDENLYVAVGVNYLKPFGNRPKYVGGSSSLTAVQSVNMLANLDIHILSRSTKALELKEQVLLALSSPYAEQQMELNGFFVAPVSTSFVNVSKIDATAIPYHFVISANIQYFNTLTTSPAYFSSFQDTAVTTDASPYVITPPAPGRFSILYAGADAVLSEVDLVWSLSPNATTYVVMRGTSSGSYPSALGSTTANEFIDLSAPLDATSYYVVQAVNTAGSTLAASEVSAYLPPPAPGSFAISGVTGSATATTVAWAAAQYAHEYLVYRGTFSGVWPTLVGSSATTSFLDTTTDFNTTYFYSVVASNQTGSTRASNQGSITTPPSFVNNDSLLLVKSSSQYVTLGNNLQNQSNVPISISAWVYLNTASTGGILSNLDANYGMNFGIINGGTQLRFEMYGISGAIVADSPLNSIVANAWNHLVVTYPGTNSASDISLYINKVKQTTSVAGAGTGPITFSQPTKIGRDFYQGYLNAYVDELSVWNTALTSAQVTSLYDNGIPNNLAGLSNLIHWYRMGDAPDTSTTIFDQVGTVNGTIVNGATIAGFTPYFVPTLISTIQVKNNPDLVLVSGNAGFVPYYQSGNPDPGYGAPDMEVLNIASPTSLPVIGTLPTPSGSPPNPQTPFTAAFIPNTNSRYLCIPYYKSQLFLQIVDVLNVGSPLVVGQVSNSVLLSSNAIAFTANGDRAYVIGSNNIGAVVNISNPTNPSLITTFTTGTGTGGDKFAFAVANGNRLFISGDSSRKLSVYDISSAHKDLPSLITAIDTVGGQYLSFSSDFSTLYVSCFVSGNFQVIDVSSPDTPVAKGVLALGTQPNWCAAYGNNLVLNTLDTTSSNFSLVSAWDEQNPFITWNDTIAANGNPTQPLSVIVFEKYAYVTSIYNPVPGTGDSFGYVQVWQIAS